MTTIKIWRQGDVGFIPVESLPFGIKKFGSNLIRHGEHGGRHVMEKTEGAEIWITAKGKAVKYLITKKPVKILHGEHNTLELPPGKYRVEIQREIGAAGLPKEVVD